MVPGVNVELGFGSPVGCEGEEMVASVTNETAQSSLCAELSSCDCCRQERDYRKRRPKEVAGRRSLVVLGPRK